ncbi:MAG: hypothetical protein P4L33_15595 [Capsulimonadaceae bacterium]|nr:hypothetical protein [Capsulimonadaceae bacterium]
MGRHPAEASGESRSAAFFEYGNAPVVCGESSLVRGNAAIAPVIVARMRASLAARLGDSLLSRGESCLVVREPLLMSARVLPGMSGLAIGVFSVLGGEPFVALL